MLPNINLYFPEKHLTKAKKNKYQLAGWKTINAEEKD